MSEEPTIPELGGRIRRLAEFLASTDVVSVRIARDGDAIEVARAASGPSLPASEEAIEVAAAPTRLEPVVADLVGIFRLGRPTPVEGEVLAADRELAFIEALGIRNPVHSLGAGRIVSLVVADGAPVEYGQTLFLMDRG